MITTVDRADEATLRALYDAHEVAVFRYALRLTEGDRGRAQDIVQETLVRAWRTPDALTDERGPLRPWLFTVARRIAIDAHRARQARPAEVDDRVLELVAATDEIDASLDRVLLLDALGALSSEHRLVIVELYYRGHTVVETARRLGIPSGTVKSRAFYGLRSLRMALAERGATP